MTRRWALMAAEFKRRVIDATSEHSHRYGYDADCGYCQLGDNLPLIYTTHEQRERNEQVSKKRGA